jgi:hypothetical protein
MARITDKTGLWEDNATPDAREALRDLCADYESDSWEVLITKYVVHRERWYVDLHGRTLMYEPEPENYQHRDIDIHDVEHDTPRH